MCLFCDIVDGKIPSYKIYEDHLVYAFLDIDPDNPGHVLVIPKKHSNNALECDDFGDVMLKVQQLALHIDATLNPDGMKICTNIKEAGGQSVFHTHIHIVPYYKKEIQNISLEDMQKKLQTV